MARILRRIGFFLIAGLVAQGQAHPSKESCSAQLESGVCLSETWSRSLGQTFEFMGPNCFSTALHLTGQARTFRAVDVGEFEAYTELACQRVQIPRSGDIGVFRAPGYLVTHAYIFVNEKWALEKPGVDYAGKTAVGLLPLEAVLYRSLASSECRRYSANSRECENEHYYLRCGSPKFPSTKWSSEHEFLVAQVEFAMAELLLKGEVNTGSRQKMERILPLIAKNLENMDQDVDVKLRRYYVERFKSLLKQSEYLK